jgi:hypothetical protein
VDEIARVRLEQGQEKENDESNEVPIDAAEWFRNAMTTSRQTVLAVLAASLLPQSLEGTVVRNSSGRFPLRDVIPEARFEQIVDNRLLIESYLARVPERSRVILYHWAIGYTLKEIGQLGLGIFGGKKVTKQAVQSALKHDFISVGLEAPAFKEDKRRKSSPNP